MKNNFNYLLKTFFLFLVLLFFSCETQEEVVSSSKRDIKKTHITLKELSSKPNAVNKIQEFKTKKSNLDSGKLIYNEEYDFYIDDQNMLLIEEGSKHWITIPIYRKKPNSNLENLILKPNENGLYQSFLASYQLTDQDRENIKNGIPVLDLDIKTSLYAVEGKYVGQLYDIGNGDCGYVNHINQISNSTIEVTFALSPCNGTEIQFGFAQTVPSDTGGGSGYTPSGYTPNFNSGTVGVGNFPTGTGSNGTQQTSGNTSTNNNILTEPTISLEEAALTSFFKNLTQQQRDFLFPNVSVDSLSAYIANPLVEEIEIYLTENAVSEESQDLIEEIINFCISNNLPFIKAKKIINEMNKICHAKILFKSLMVESPFTELIKNNLLIPSDRNLVFRNKPAEEMSSPNVGATTDKDPLYIEGLSSAYAIEITFNNNHLISATNLGLINTLYHELLHAYFIDLYKQGLLLSTYPSYTELNTAFANYYADSTISTGTAVDNQLHDVFVDFIPVLSQALYNYSIANNITGVDIEYTEKLVWAGLYGTPTFTTNLTPTQQTEVLNTSTHENFNSPLAKGSKPCID